MRILLWHGYLLGGTGSNVYTRQLAREWARAGHDVTVFSQEPHPELYDLGGAEVDPARRRRAAPRLRPRPLRRLRGQARAGLHSSRARPLGRGECGGGSRAAPGRSRLLQPRAPRGAGRSRDGSRRTPSRRTARSSSTRCAGGPRSGPGGGRRSPALRPCSSARRTSERCSRRCAARSTASTRCRPGSTWTNGGRGRARRRLQPCSPRPGAIRRIPRTPTSASRTKGMPSDSRRSSTEERPTVVYFGKLLRNKGVHVLLEALSGLDARAVVVGFGDYRAGARGARRPRARRSSPDRSSTATSFTCWRSRTRASCPPSSPRRSAWSPPRRRPPAARRSSRGTPGSRRSRKVSRPSIHRISGTSRPSRRATRTSLREKLRELLALPPARRAAISEAARRAVVGALELGERRGATPRSCRRLWRQPLSPKPLPTLSLL